MFAPCGIQRQFVMSPSGRRTVLCLAVACAVLAGAVSGCSKPASEEPAPRAAAPAASETPAPPRPAIPSDRVTTVTGVETPPPPSGEDRVDETAPPAPEEPAPAPAPPVVAVEEPTETVSEAAPAGEDAREAETAAVTDEQLRLARQSAETVRRKALTQPVMEAAPSVLDAAGKHLADAAGNETANPAEALAAYQLAEKLYGEALQKTEAQAEAARAAATARAAALEKRNQVTQETRTLAQKEAVAGDTAWNAAENADAPEQAKALYDVAQDEYAKALRIAEERASEHDETAAKALQNLETERANAQKAQAKITGEVRKLAQQQAAQADALWDLATQTAGRDPAKAAELFGQARAQYDAAVAAAENAKHQEFVTELREQGVVVAPAGGDYTTIGEAIAAAAPDTPILIKPGVYRETIVIDKPVALIGDGARNEIRIESTGADCITIKAGQAVLHGLTLRSASGFGDRGVYTVYCAQGRLLIEYCDIATDSLSAVAVKGAETVPVIRGCNIHDSTQAGIFFYDGARGIIDNCEIAGNGLAGIQIKSGAHPTVRQCKIRQNKGSGVFVNDGGRGIIEGCDISQNALAGISITTAGNPTVRDCNITNNRGYGIRAYEGGHGDIGGCALSGNQPEGWFVGDDCEVVRQNNRD